MAGNDDILHDSAGNDGSKISLGAGSRQPGEDKLLAYLNGTLPPAEQHDIEEWLSEEGMESDAIEGLKMLEPTDTRQSVTRLNTSLRKALHTRKDRRRPAKTDANTLIAVVVIILLMVVAYLVIRMIK